MAKPSFHEALEREEAVEGSSDRGFGYVFTAVFAIVGLWPLLNGAGPRWWALALAAVVLALSLAYPKALRPFNALWTRFGLLLHKLVNPVILAIMFYGVITPIGLIRRLFNRDPMHLKADPSAKSYWIARGPVSEQRRMTKQF